MENEGTKINRLSVRRFGLIIFLFRLGGIPLRMKKISTIYTIYTKTLIFSVSSNCVGLFLERYLHWDHLRRAITAMRVFIPF
jgi:hypothetical protein